MIFEETSTKVYRVRCTAPWDAPECCGTGPRGCCKQEAKELAAEQGWYFTMDGTNHAVCPCHLKAMPGREET